MKFKNWFLSEGQNIVFTSWMRDGTIVVYIDNTKYIFLADAIDLDEIKKLARFKPWTALNQIKEMIKNNRATQIEPKSVENTQKQPIQKMFDFGI